MNGCDEEIPDGAVIIKEQFSPTPAARYHGIAEKYLWCSNDWTIMIKNSKVSFDGWFWAELWNDSPDVGKMSLEQATYPEWLNSDYRDEYGSVGATPKTCQDCHMSGGYANTKTDMYVTQIQNKIAIVQDGTYPAADHLAKPDDVNVRYRETGFKRHELLGTNGFLLRMFLKPVDKLRNNEALGVRLSDYVSGLTTESFQNGAYQPHFNQSNPIRSRDQVQIYEELTQNADHQFTTSFSRRDYDVKDNRLLPAGWSLHGPKDLKIPGPVSACDAASR